MLIDPTLDDRVASLTSKLGQSVIVHRLSGYRPADYQTHLYRLSLLYSGIYAATLTESGVTSTCATEIAHANLEVERHHLSHKTVNGVAIPGQLLVGISSRHSAQPANALDVAVTPSSGEPLLRSSLSAYGLYAPCHEGSIHLQTTATCSGSTRITAVASAPVTGSGLRSANAAIEAGVPLKIIVRDPLGRRIGYDSVTGTVVNEIGATASYAGVNSDPQVVTIDDAMDGDYRVDAVVVASGDYLLTVSSDDTEDGTPINSNTQSGHVVAGDHPDPLGLTMKNTVTQEPARHHAVKH
jgi:hypothetical protein